MGSTEEFDSVLTPKQKVCPWGGEFDLNLIKSPTNLQSEYRLEGDLINRFAQMMGYLLT